MSNFFRSTWVKIAVAILCVLSLAASFISGFLMLFMLSAGCYDRGTDLFTAMAEDQMRSDAQSIMWDYFDPQEPASPWVSFYEGGIYTGEDSNFLYNIVDSETGYSVLATVTGGEAIEMKQEYDFSFDIEVEEPLSDRYTVTDQVFRCDGVVYGYEESSQYFFPLDEDSVRYLTDIPEYPTDIFLLGFSFSYDNGTPTTENTPIHFDYDGEGFFSSGSQHEYSYVQKDYTIICYLLKGLPENDVYQTLHEAANLIYGRRFNLISLFAATFLFGLVLLILLGCNVGRVKGKTEAVVPLIYRLPSDITLAACLIAALCCGAMGAELMHCYGSRFYAALSLMAVLAVLGFILCCVYGFCTLCVRAKTHTLISGSFLHWCWRNAGKLLKKVGKGCEKTLGYLPLIWKVAVCYALLCFLELIFMMMFLYDFNGVLIFFWLVEKIALGALVGYVALAFRRLKQGAEAIAAGDYTTKVDTEHLVLELKDTAETLNNIQGGMNAAVESRMKSERLKTELITNVSHDIKTPLTSIVSYVDLLKKEPAGSDAAAEYLEVLDRQSARLKKLVEDLVEASKASTGNITVHAEKMDLSVLLGQALGEYSERLMNTDLTPVVKLPEYPVMVSADGRLLWRIFDNLLGNAVKYAMPGTRIYVTVTADSHAIVTFRNISREPLDISADELMERFVRGDASRHTEGSGLGLSIAKSLTESMGGQFLLNVDGDLFKAAVIFPMLPPETPETT